MITSSQNASTDVFFKAANSAAASNASSIIPGGNIDIAINKAYQDINQTISQIVSEKCSTTVNNDMNNVSLFAQSSNIGGNMVIGQSGSSNGNCTLSNQMTATALATGTIDNCAISGKKAKECGGKGGSSILTYVLYGVGIIIAFAVIMFVIHFIRGYMTPDTKVVAAPAGAAVVAPSAPRASPVASAALPQGAPPPPPVIVSN